MQLDLLRKTRFVEPRLCPHKHPHREVRCELDEGHTGNHLGGEPFPDYWTGEGVTQFADWKKEGRRSDPWIR